MNQTDRGSAPSARAIEIRANKHAELFVDAYYSVYDSSTRTNKLPEFYRPDARIVWNGNAIAGLPAFSSTLLSQLSYSKHEVQSFDAHAIPGSVIAPSVLPTITITISGQVIFSAQPFPSNFRMPDPKDISPKQNPADAQQALDGLPRVFSQTLILAPSPTPSESSQPISISNYAIVADCFRFVG
ncbi:hypothetical protein MJO28_000875 [Puccinia striiformis f. sp. tritici]|uniref:NTF2 domain-containing protein n=2 Tax=Puccinia striiformis f. sp. tritici TaxID=168172 RepID=A0A0L0VRX8_9BASI|nr:hypothetical protein Pst134EA_000375 [Puccinia striiformis f. sp. tritici]KAI9601385.1 hypothetical protein H4Q26_001203 [Puccinia striiformis f. sp. tritici PST-130]KNF01775.1 hypothetical protein PSTG_04896 [Puccinia striiformis f. sp. tritici PST-78]KAH9466539.1 hypothetical protein Pst134EB_001591 [Puccinia striiformis f. sp. tritici]KAH9473302.1 hypothetical protein Pst134EA_000375 [Puccinia striiformis f. sp. tritici]KAI7962781.1 hypothetical protein MJO28_000875 [Puccinia striiformis